MTRYLNLVQDRGPSAPAVSRNWMGWGRTLGTAWLVTNSALRLWDDAHRRRRPTRLHVGAAFAAGAAIGFAVWPVVRTIVSAKSATRMDAAIDRDSADSFPASDPPQRGR